MDNGNFYRHLFITGLPGVGKTTLVCRLCDILRRESIPLRGFYTTEVRGNYGRTGFEIVTVDGSRRATLATVKPPPGGPYPNVGKYSVMLNQFEPLALDVLKGDLDSNSSTKNAVFVIDEIGKMELTSRPFGDAALQVFNQPSTIVIATIPAKPLKQLEVFAGIRHGPSAKLFEITKQNRDATLQTVHDCVRKAIAALGFPTG
ncbi:cancer nucleoside triphosphatase [Trichuris trichiura]|uniref:Cancer nucleoside triphosphatase n=1 Tax=Trichuris trichiura TaxID=36087 RepID=A0A077Z5N8_TRITR|nr:cancer nucleoside triphosphatase [Trichuris trichiura]